MLSDDDLKVILSYLSAVAGKTVRSADDLLAMGTEPFLDLTEKIPDEALPIVVSLFKSTLHGRELFIKLTGDPDEPPGKKAAAFFKRYSNLVLAQEDTTANFNPLLLYLPPESFDDLAFIQSRQSFFLRQTVDTINEFLKTACRCTDIFGPGQQEEAWIWYWNYLLRR
jgi:hypothetical protein